MITPDADALELKGKLVFLVGHARRGWQQEAARLLGVNENTIGRNLRQPNDTFLSKVEDALREKAAREPQRPLAEEPRMILEARLARLEAYRRDLDEAGREAFASGADWYATRKALGL